MENIFDTPAEPVVEQAVEETPDIQQETPVDSQPESSVEQPIEEVESVEETEEKPAEPVKETPKYFDWTKQDKALVKFKQDGKDVEATLREVIDGFNSQVVSQKRFAEAAETRKTSEAQLKKINDAMDWLVEDPQGFFDELARVRGTPDFKTMAAEILTREIEDQHLAKVDPDKFKMQQRIREVDKAEKQQASQAEKAKQLEADKVEDLKKGFAVQLDSAITKVLSETHKDLYIGTPQQQQDTLLQMIGAIDSQIAMAPKDTIITPELLNKYATAAGEFIRSQRPKATKPVVTVEQVKEKKQNKIRQTAEARPPKRPKKVETSRNRYNWMD